MYSLLINRGWPGQKNWSTLKFLICTHGASCLYLQLLQTTYIRTIVTNHPAFCLNIPQKRSSSRYPALTPQIPTFWVSVLDLGL